jgi:nitric oxide reductase NorQ protein
MIDIIKDAASYKPDDLSITDLKWKFLFRCVYKGKNILFVGPTGCGKTKAVYSAASALSRPFFKFNCGAMQDPQLALIGSTHFSKENGGTFFAESEFVTAIQTPNSVILLDELSRCHPDGWNILLPVLDETQRYLRLDKTLGNRIIPVAAGVCFIATANVGNQYTATRVMDEALLNRFPVTVEMTYLSKSEEIKLVKKKFPSIEDSFINKLIDIADFTRTESSGENPKLSKCLSTRAVLELAELYLDGFKQILDIAEVGIYPLFLNDGGIENERTLVKQYIQKFSEPVVAEAVTKNLVKGFSSSSLHPSKPF